MMQVSLGVQGYCYTRALDAMIWTIQLIHYAYSLNFERLGDGAAFKALNSLRAVIDAETWTKRNLPRGLSILFCLWIFYTYLEG